MADVAAIETTAVVSARDVALFVRTLDAIHLASAIAAGEAEVVATDNGCARPRCFSA